MGPLPKKKTSLSRKRRRRTHISASVPTLVQCSQCRSPKMAHRACSICGTYRGREVLSVGRDRTRPAAQ